MADVIEKLIEKWRASANNATYMSASDVTDGWRNCADELESALPAIRELAQLHEAAALDDAIDAIENMREDSRRRIREGIVPSPVFGHEAQIMGLGEAQIILKSLIPGAGKLLDEHDEDQREIGQQSAEAILQSYLSGGPPTGFVHELTKPMLDKFVAERERQARLEEAREILQESTGETAATIRRKLIARIEKDLATLRKGDA
jgi:hypothetical protein